MSSESLPNNVCSPSRTPSGNPLMDVTRPNCSAFTWARNVSDSAAGAADWLAIHDEPGRPAEQRLTCVLEIHGHIADTVLREPAYPYADRSRSYDEASFLAAIERQDEAGAIALLNGALGSGFGFADLERAISTAALAQYNDFAH